jgi:hypothetical protein
MQDESHLVHAQARTSTVALEGGSRLTPQLAMDTNMLQAARGQSIRSKHAAVLAATVTPSTCINASDSGLPHAGVQHLS